MRRAIAGGLLLAAALVMTGACASTPRVASMEATAVVAFLTIGALGVQWENEYCMRSGDDSERCEWFNADWWATE